MFGYFIFLLQFTSIRIENQEFIDKFTINLKNLKLLRYLQNEKYTDFQKINIIHYNLENNSVAIWI
jgi:hypothetical protein